jgi:type I restriction-modification system DNA methylase subunit
MINKEKAKQLVEELIKKYNKIIEEKRIDIYVRKEAMTKKDFILPLFEALGWNVQDEPDRNDNVSAEETISKGFVDFGFRINGIPKFFLEAKPMKEDLDNPKLISQAINYAWHKGCTWALLTDFESINIFNAEWEIAIPFQSHFKTILCYEFLDRFDELWLLSKESFEQDLLDKEAEKWGKKTKKIPIDEQLLVDFTKFRELLSKNIMKLNQDKNLTEEDLDESVQKILDRLIFIRNCEDRELEEKKLWEAKTETKTWKKVKEIFKYYDNKYNSKLFAYNPMDLKKGHLCDNLNIDDKIMQDIIECLYHIKDKFISYDFSAIEADVLGNIYEQYLGHILRKSEKRAKLTENHAHRKEQGIYYTPIYIVNYIVRNTLGELLKDKKLDAEKIRVLDPACGSGSFLIKAFDVINEHYIKHDKNYLQTQIDFKTGGAFTTKVRILKDNIFGVDLDKQAVEIAQLNLLLKITEKGRRLPLLQENIKCGNSLIDDPTITGDKAFKWKEQFKEVMQEGGFDVVIGNPPYIFVRGQKFSDKEKNYYYSNYSLVQYQLNTYLLFIEKAIKLLKINGYFGFIIPNTWQTIDNFSRFRKYLFENMSDITIINITDKVFLEANVETNILIFKKEKACNKKVSLWSFNEGKLENLFEGKSNSFGKSYIVRFSKESIDKENIIIEKIASNSITLSEIATIKAGLKAYEVGKGKPKQTEEMKDKRIYHSKIKIDKDYYKYLEGKDVCRYFIKWGGNYLKYGECLAAPRTFDLFSSERILVRQIPSRLPYCINASYVNEVYLNDINSMIIYNFKKYSSKLILALINSKLISYWFNVRFNKLQRELFPQFKVKELEIFPIHKSIDKFCISKMLVLVDKMFSFNRRLNEIGDKKTDERAKIEEEIKKTDVEIDGLAYRIYGITKAEKKILEESLR